MNEDVLNIIFVSGKEVIGFWSESDIPSIRGNFLSNAVGRVIVFPSSIWSD